MCRKCEHKWMGNKKMRLKFQKISTRAYFPKRSTKYSSGLDVYSPIDTVIKSWSDALIPLDLRFEIPEGWDLSIYNKSSISSKKKLFKGAELVDSDYRGNVFIHLFNFSNVDVEIKKGEKIAQLVMRKVWLGEIEEVEEIKTNTERGEGGFGSTGTK